MGDFGVAERSAAEGEDAAPRRLVRAQGILWEFPWEFPWEFSGETEKHQGKTWVGWVRYGDILDISIEIDRFFDLWVIDVVIFLEFSMRWAASTTWRPSFATAAGPQQRQIAGPWASDAEGKVIHVVNTMPVAQSSP